MFHLRNAQMHLNAAISDRSFKRECCPKDVMGLACLREAYNKIEEARELFAEADADRGESKPGERMMW